MISLSNLSTIEIIGSKNILSRKNISNANKEFIRGHELNSVEELLTQNLPYSGDECQRNAEKMQKQLQATLVNAEPESFYTGVINCCCDSNVYGTRLLYKPQFLYGTRKYNSETNTLFGDAQKIVTFPFNVFELKHFLAFCDTKGNSLFRRYVSKDIDEAEISKLIRAIELYDDQIIRQADDVEAKKEFSTLFQSNQGEKCYYVRKKIDDVIEAFSKADELVWGKVEEAEQDMFNSLLNHNAAFIRENLVRTIADYTSLDEAKNSLTDQKVLKRFIVK